MADGMLYVVGGNPNGMGGGVILSTTNRQKAIDVAKRSYFAGYKNVEVYDHQMLETGDGYRLGISEIIAKGM